MNKLNQMRLIGLVTLNAKELTPITYVQDSIVYGLLLNKFEKFERWRNTRKVPRQEFEEHLNQSEELVNAYLDTYHKSASFYKCVIKYNQIQFDYYVMMRQKRIILFFFHVSKT